MPNDKAKELTARELIALKRGDEFEPVATCKDYLQVQNELKPCPSCGAKNTDKVTHITELYDADKYKYGRCYMCGLKMYSWNTRPIEDALQARIAELEAALDKAAHQLYDYSGSCPSDLYDWEHPNTCIRECDRYDNPDEAWKCWRLWLLEKPKEEK